MCAVQHAKSLDSDPGFLTMVFLNSGLVYWQTWQYCFSKCWQYVGEQLWLKRKLSFSHFRENLLAQCANMCK
jgi:hypothetical protein